MLEFAEKYNWWTKDKSNISVDSKIEYVLRYGTLEDLKKTVEEVGSAKIKEVWRKRKPKIHWNNVFRCFLDLR